jgi:hypothetical protein
VKKIILDENMPRRLGNLITGHSVTTVQKAGWAGIGNGELLTLLDGKFDVFLTSDKNLRYQQNLRGRKIAIVELPFNSLGAKNSGGHRRSQRKRLYRNYAPDKLNKRGDFWCASGSVRRVPVPTDKQ